MDFHLTETQQMIRDMVRDFAQGVIAPVAEKNNRDGVFPEDIFRRMGPLGLLGVNIPERFGGAEAGAVAASLAITEVAKVCASTAVGMSVTNMVAEVINAFGTESQRQRFLPPLMSGAAITGSFSLTEPGAGSDAGALRTRAVRDGDHYILNGTKVFITSGSYSGVQVVWARTGEQKGARGVSAFVVERDAPGLSIGKREHKMGLLASDTVEVVFEDCRIPAENLLGEEHKGFRIAMMALDGGRIGIASQALGIAQAALDASLRYAGERQQFGQKLSAFQATQFKLADMATRIEAARLLTLQAAWLKEHKHPFTREASMAKVFSTEGANEVAAHAVQIHGGYGYLQDFPVERFYRDARVTTIYEGASEVQRMVIARSLLEG